LVAGIGGVLLFISTLLDWRGSGPFGSAGTSTDFQGLQGILCLIIGIAVAVVAGIRAFGVNVNLPERILGFSLNQLILILGFAAFLTTFGLQFGDFVEFGVTLAWIASGAIVAGAVIERMQGDTAGSTTPPTQF
jgi:hypothetical protein